MKDERAGDQIVARIGFAETWLGRAKRQVAEGNLARGILTLVLADAEVHHAIEVAGLPARRGPAPRVPPAALPIALLALAIVTAAGLPRTPAPVAVAEGGAPVITLASRAGSLLRLIPAPADAAEPLPAMVEPARRPPVPARPAVHPMRQAPAAPAAPPPAVVNAAPVPTVTAAPAAPPPLVQAPPAVSTPPITLTAGDLIDLVLAAERTLRGGQGR